MGACLPASIPMPACSNSLPLPSAPCPLPAACTPPSAPPLLTPKACSASRDSHGRRGQFWGLHPGALFQLLAKLLVDLHPRVRGGSWQQERGVGWVGKWEAGSCCSAQFPKSLCPGRHGGCASCSSWRGPFFVCFRQERGTALPVRLAVGTGALQPFQHQQGSWITRVRGASWSPSACPQQATQPATQPSTQQCKSGCSHPCAKPRTAPLTPKLQVLAQPRMAQRTTSPPSHCIY